MKEQYKSLDFNKTESDINLNCDFYEKSLYNISQNENDFFLDLSNLYPTQNYDNIIDNENLQKMMFVPSLENTKLDMTSKYSPDSIYCIKDDKNESQSKLDNISSIVNKNLPSSESQSDNLSKSTFFKTVLYHKRGRKILENQKNKNYHGSEDFDNILRKIQVNFISFLIKLANDAIKSVLGKKCAYFFRDIKYEFKRKINHNNVEYLKQCKYSDIIQKEISAKSRKYGENLNKDTFLKICKISPELQNFFDKNYLYIFQKYYYILKDNQNIVDFDGLKVKLSPSTKGFNELLKKENRKDKFISVCQLVFFSGINFLNDTNEKKKFNSNQFMVSNIEIKEE